MKVLTPPRLRKFAAVSAALLLPSSFCHAQGSLTPPPGAPAATMKTLDQVEARTPVNATTCPGDAISTFIISQPGSYYFTSHLTSAAGKNGITITASNVTLDLNGFTFTGSTVIPQGGIGRSGISAPGNVLKCAVRNGTITSCGGVGLDMPFISAKVSDLTITACGSAADAATGGLKVHGLVEHCRCVNNGGYGFVGDFGAVFHDCLAESNGQDGYTLGYGCTLRDCTASGNGFAGFTGLGDTVLSGCVAHTNATGFAVRGTMSHCLAFNSKGDGFKVSGNLSHCSAKGNGTSGTGDGIDANATATLTDCDAANNADLGIRTVDDCTLKNCSAVSNGDGGITAGQRCQITGCTASGNGTGALGTGILTGIRGTVSQCQTMNNRADGISVGGDSVVSACHSSANGVGANAAGIRTPGGGCRIEGNATRDNIGTGILATATDIIIRNSSGGNTSAQYNPGSGANFAPIQTPAAQTNPNANN